MTCAPPRGAAASRGQQVVVGLGGQARHEVELDLLGAGGEGAPHAGHDVLLGDVLVDHVAQALAARLGREGEGRRPLLLYQAVEALVQGVNAQAGQLQRRARVADPLEDARHRRAQARVVAGRERQQRHLFPAEVARAGDGAVDDLGHVALAHRAGDHPRLAEAAAPHAAPHDLQRQAVVDRLDHRHQGGRRRERVQVAHDARLGAARLARPPQAGDGADPGQQRGAVLAGPLAVADGVRDLQQRLLPVAHAHDVGEGAQHRRVRGAVPADEHQRVAVAAVGRAQRHARQVEHRQQVGQAQLVAQREADHVERARRPTRLQREQGQAPLPQQRLEVGPGREREVGVGVLARVDRGVEDAQAVVGDAQLVGVGVGEQEVGAGRVPVLARRAQLPAQVAPRAGDQGQHAPPQRGAQPLRIVVRRVRAVATALGVSGHGASFPIGTGRQRAPGVPTSGVTAPRSRISLLSSFSKGTG